MPAPSRSQAKAAILDAAAVSLTTACVSLDISQATGSRMVTAGTFPVPVIRMGTRVIVPTEPLRKLLHLDSADAGVETGGAA
jgi:predicted site-specific integrase-resolvase